MIFRPLFVGLLFLATAGCAPGGGQPPALPSEDAGVVLFFGDSITAGATLDAAFTYPALLQERLGEAGLDYRTVNAGIDGDTTAGGISRLDDALALGPVLVVVELGVNDAFRGVPSDRTRANLERLVIAFRESGAKVLLAGVELGHLGRSYGFELGEVHAAVARSTDVPLVADLLLGVAGQPSMNLPDGVHPNAEGHREIAARLWPALETALRGP